MTEATIKTVEKKLHVNQQNEIDGRSTCVAWAVCSPLPPRGQYCKCKDNHQHLKPAVEGAFQSYGEGWGGSKLVTIAAEQVWPLCSWKSALLKILWTLKILTLLLHRRFVDLVWNSKSQLFYSVSIFISETSGKRKNTCNRQQRQLEPTSYSLSLNITQGQRRERFNFHHNANVEQSSGSNP